MKEKIAQLETESKKYKSNESKCTKLTKENKELENENKKLIQNSNQQLAEFQDKMTILETELNEYKKPIKEVKPKKPTKEKENKDLKQQLQLQQLNDIKQKLLESDDGKKKN